MIFHCMDVSHFLFSFIGWWKFVFFGFYIKNAVIIYVHVFVCLYVFIPLGYAVNIYIQVLLWKYVLFLLDRYLGVELLGSGDLMFNIWEICQAVFQSDCISPISPHPFHSLLSFDYSHSRVWSRISLWFLIYTSPMTEDAEYLFMCLLAICVSFWEMSIHLFCPFFKWVVFLLLSCKSSLWIRVLYQIDDLQIFCPVFVGCLLFFSMITFEA